MSEHEPINFLKPQREFSPESAPFQERPQKKKRGIHFVIIFSIIALFGIAFFTRSIANTHPSDIEESVSLFQSFRHLVGAGNRTSSAESDDRINILLLGIGGAGHAGAELTDTIILGSFKPSTSEVGMISVPRDLTLSIPDHGYTKINAVNAYAEQKKSGSGIKETKNAIETIMDEKIDYTVKVNFSSFAKIIDAIGGIDVFVDTAFTDSEYPIDGKEDAECTTETTETTDPTLAPSSPTPSYNCRYEVLSFSQGWTHMNGATALKYARSRHGNNGEGSDFARAARQQKVILAWKERALSAGVLLNPVKLQAIANTIRDNVTTDMTLWDMIDLAKYADDIHTETIASHVIDAKSGLVYNSYLGNAYVLWPRKEDWSEFHNLANEIFSSSKSSTNISTAKKSASAPQITIEIQNGTKQVGLASQTAQLLESSGYGIVSIANAENTSWEKTTVFDFTGGKKDAELAALKSYLNADIIMTSAGALQAQDVSPSAVWDAKQFSLYRTNEKTDFVIILGENSGTLVMSSYAY